MANYLGVEIPPYKNRITAHGLSLGVSEYRHVQVSRASDGAILYRSPGNARRLKPLYAAFQQTITPEMGQMIEVYSPGQCPDDIRRCRDMVAEALRPHLD